uniref:USP domain-containing protein n=1 Tax=Arcella intermedia TaxID=1963864 RepID=A0A6B2KW10_9EUKA
MQRIMAKMMGMFQAFENLYALENPTVLHQCAEYFSLLNQVFDIIHSRKLISLNASGAQWSFSLTIDLVKIIISMLSKHPIIETTSSSPVDIFLVGLLNTLKNLLSKNPGLKSSLAYGSSILNLVYRKCLFELPEPSTPHHFFPPLCKTPRSRVAAFAVLFELVKDKFGRKNFEYVLEELMQLHKQQILRKDWSYSPPLYEKASCGFVGLQNLGATCYMNSLLQQFYMRPEFRYGILSVEDTAEKKEESLLYQLQTIFTNLQESAKKSYDPTDFCKACIVDGRPIRTNEQMDVDEFFNKLFDKIESLLKDTPQKKMLDHFFGGNLVNQIISKECDHCSERIESFFTLSLEVKNKNHINESLDLFVQGDVLDGENKYFCGDCNKKVTALKRSCISKLPNNLILHLKRFEYDLTTNRRSKVNQYCSFEFQLDLEPFTKEGLDRREKGTQQAEDIHPDYYIYELTGILVHTGTTESGHYYSYIRDPNTKLWYLFNDQSVTPFDISQMPDQCYGGFEYSTVWDPILQKPVPKQYPKHNNAYMLFYDRVYKDNSQLVPSIPEALFQEVWKKNRKFLIDKTLFDSDYSNFMRNMLDMAQQDQSVDEELRIKLIELGTRYFIQPLAHSRDKSKLPDFTRILKFLYSGNELACKWFLQTLINNNWLFDMLFQCDTPEVQFQFVELVNYVVSEMDKIESEKYDEYINELENTATQEKENSETQGDQMTVENDSVLVVPKFLYVLVELRKNVFKYPKYYMYYFYLFEKITLIGGKMRSLLIRMNIPKIFVELFTKIPEKNSALRKNCKYLVGTLSILARGSIIERHPGNPSPLELEECCPVANPETFIDYEFVYNAISDGTNNEAIANILVHLSWNNEQFSTKVVENIAKGFEKDTFSNYGNHFEIFRVLLNINDSLKPTRMKSITRNFVNITNQFLKFKNATASSISFLLDYIKQYQSENVLEVLDEMKAQWFIWILYEEKEVARTCTRDLILSLSPLTPSPITEETLSAIRPRLHEMIHLLLNVLATNRTQYISFAKPTECGSIKEIKQYDFALVQYFSLLQLFILSKEEQDLFKDHITNFVDLLPYTNHSLVPQNCNQLEMVKFFWVLTRKNPELLEVLAKSKNFMDHYLSITMSPQTIEFNSNFLFYYYRLLAKILKIFPEFQEKVFNHTSFYWAIKNIYLSPSYPNLSGKLQSILDLVMNDERRFVIVEKLVPDLKNMDLCLKKSLSLLTTYLNMNSLIAFNFIQNKGLTQLSDRITKLGKTVIQESLLVILKFLELLFLKIADPAQEELRNVLCEYSDQITQITLKLSDLVISPQTLDILKIITNTLLQIVTLTYRNDIQTVHYTQVARLSLNLLIQHFSKVVKPAVESVSIEYIEHRTTFICKLCSLFLFPEEQFDCLEEKTLEEVESKAIHLVVKEGFEAFKTSFSSRAVVISLLFRIWSNDKLQGKLKSETTFVPLIFSLLSTSFFPMDMHTGIGFQFLSSVIPEIMRNMDQDTKSKLLQTITNNFFLLKVTPIEEETLLVQGLIGIFSIISELEEGLQELFKSEVDCTWVKEILEHLKDTTPDKDRLKVLLW